MRALLRLTTLGDREFTLYLLDLFKMADRQRVGAITAQNRRMALAFLNLELERATESTLMTSLDLDNSGALDFREFVALVRRLSRLPLLPRPPLLITPNPNPEPQTLTLTRTPSADAIPSLTRCAASRACLCSRASSKSTTATSAT